MLGEEGQRICQGRPHALSVSLSFLVGLRQLGKLLPQQAMVPGRGGKSALPLPADAAAPAPRDPSRACDLHHSSRQHQVPNRLSQARDRTRILTVPSRRELQAIFGWFSVFGHVCGMQKFPGQESNPSHSRDPSHYGDNAGSLTAGPPGNP